MGTRSGNLDPAILQFLMNKYGYTADEMLNILNKKSGVLGISGVGSDFRDLEKAAKEGNERAQARSRQVRLRGPQVYRLLCGCHGRR